MLKPNSIIGILGGGQLGRMAAMAAASLGYRVHIYSDAPESASSHICYKFTTADYLDEAALEAFAREVDLVSFEFENVPFRTLEILEKFAVVRPSSKVIRICQHRIREKNFINSLGVKTAQYVAVNSAANLKAAVAEIGVPAILKTCEMGYDGKGQVKIDGDELPDVAQESVLEGMVDFSMEISVIVARNVNGEIRAFDAVENRHKNHILDETIAPAVIPDELKTQAKEIAVKIAEGLQLEGILAVEMFVTKDGLVVNELAPRPHNSGHYTIDACVTSQFEQFIRAICGLPLGEVRQHTRAVMKNLMGDEVLGAQKFLQEPDCKLHLYGKRTVRAGRKMGHVTRLLG